MGPYYRMIALVFAIACLFELSGTRGMVITTLNGRRGSNGGGGSGGSGSSGGCRWRSGAATHTAHDWAVNSQPWPYDGMIALTVAITSTFFFVGHKSLSSHFAQVVVVVVVVVVVITVEIKQKPHILGHAF